MFATSGSGIAFAKRSDCTGSGRTKEGITVSLHNRTAIPVTVRELRLSESYPFSSIVLNFGGVGTSVIDERFGKIGEKRTSHHVMVSRPVETRARDFVELPSHTDATWIVLNVLIAKLDWTFAACRVVIEYTTVFGNHAVIPIFAAKTIVDQITRTYTKHREDLLNPPSNENK